MKKLFLLIILMMTVSCALAEGVDFSALYPDKFLPEGSEPIVTETSYQSANICLTITSLRYEDCDVFVADVYVRSMDCLRRAYAGGEWRSRRYSMRDTAEDSGAILALTGDSSYLITQGWVMGNGEVLQSKTNKTRDIAIVYRDGTMDTVYRSDIDYDYLSAHTDDIWHIFLFGPMLLDEQGNAIESFKGYQVRPKNPRAAIGYYAPGHYCLVQVDGRGTKSQLESGKTNKGLTLEELSALMAQLGCTAAYNLDGGQSAIMWYNGEYLNNPYKGGRYVSDIVILIEPDSIPNE